MPIGLSRTAAERGWSIGPFQDLHLCRWDFHHWDSGSSGLLSDYGCEGAGIEYRILSGSLGLWMAVFSTVSLADSWQTVSAKRLVSSIGPFQDLQGHRLEYLLPKPRASRTLHRLWLERTGIQL